MHRRCVGGVLGVAAVIATAGCTQKGGGLLPSAAGTASPMTWDSTAALPKTIVIVDTRTGENVFEINIPMGQQLSVQFHTHKDPQKHPEAPDIMKYTLHPLGHWVGHLSKSVAVPHAWNRRIDVFLQSQEAYTAPDPAREVVPFGVPMPDQAESPTVEAAAAPEAAPTPGPPPAPEVKTESPAEPEPAPETPADDTPSTPEAAPEPQPPTRDAEPTPAESAPEPDPAEAPPASPPAPAPPKVAAIRTTPTSTMTWTDTGHTRRVSVSDMRTGKDVFELDVPKGHDLVMHFHAMWSPPGTDQDREAMHWQIVPAGGTVTVPAHHATVPGESHRRVSEQGVDTPTPKPAPVVPTKTDAAPPAAEPTPAVPVDLLDDEPEKPAAEPATADSPS